MFVFVYLHYNQLEIMKENHFSAISLRKKDKNFGIFQFEIEPQTYEFLNSFNPFFSQWIECPIQMNAVTYNYEGRPLETIECNHPVSVDNAIIHDQLYQNCNLDKPTQRLNHLIEASLGKISSRVYQIAFFIDLSDSLVARFSSTLKVKIHDRSSVTKSTIPDYTIDIQELEKDTPIVLGKLVRSVSSWNYYILGQPVKAYSKNETVKEIQRNFL